MKQQRTRSAETVFALSLLVLFAGLSLFLVVIGGNTYRAITARMNENNEVRTSLSYITNKVHASGGGAAVQSEDGVDTLVLGEGDYVTYIYTYEHALYEYYTSADAPFAPNYGEKLVEDVDLSFAQEGNFLRATLTQADGSEESVTLRLAAAAQT